MCTACLSRRSFLRFGAAAATVPLAGCDGPPDLVSDRQVAEMGLRAWQEIRGRMPLSRNQDLIDVTDRVSARLLRAAGQAPQDWEVRVFASPEANAFALPGGKIGVYEGMFRAARTPDQLAAIVGHEIGHLQAEHARDRMNAQIAKQAGLRIVAFLLNLGEVDYADEIAAALGLGVEFGLVLPYSRKQELEADRLGLIAAARADFDPAEAVQLWQRMEALGGARSPEFLATHPAPGSRIEAIRAMLPEIT